MKITAIIKADGTFTNQPPLDKKYTLDELQKIVGGYIEIIGTPQGKILVINEEGKLKGLPINIAATDIAGQEIVGDALYTERSLIK